MKYTYNAERDRIANRKWVPHFISVSFRDNATGETRSMMLHVCTDIGRHMRTIAEKYANEGEVLTDAIEVPRKLYENWLCGKEVSDSQERVLDILGVKIPAGYVTDYLIAEDGPSGYKHSEQSRYGDLSLMRGLLAERDANLCQSLIESWEKAQPDKDIVREEPEPLNDRMHEYLLKD